jgi:hypothetical protein
MFAALPALASAPTPAPAHSDGQLPALLNEDGAALAAWQDAPTDLLAPPIGPKPWDAPLTAAAQLPARTPDGLCAKAEAAADWLVLGDRGSGLPHCCRNGEEQVTWSLLRDLLPELPAAWPSPSPAVPTPVAVPDAELVAACQHHAVLEVHINGGDCGELDDNNPMWVEYGRALAIISEAEPQTMTGWPAKARAAKIQARMLGGSEEPDSSMAADWCWHRVNDMLRLRAEGAT